jgi:thioredoxin 1
MDFPHPFVFLLNIKERSGFVKNCRKTADEVPEREIVRRGFSNADFLGKIKAEIRSEKGAELKMSVITITKENFKSVVEDSAKPVLVDFWASWCMPCRMVSPVVDEIGEESDGSYTVGKINVDEQPELAVRFNVMSIPTLIVFRNGKAAASAIGVRGKEEILSMLA